MPIDMPRGLPFAVDTWGPSSRHRRHRFLTHAHRDHLVGAGAAADESGGTVYATRLTLALALRHFPQVITPLVRSLYVLFCLPGKLFLWVGACLLNALGAVVAQLESWGFVDMEVGRTVAVDDPAGAFAVTAYDANHCPGNLFVSSYFTSVRGITVTIWFISIGT